MKTINQTTNFTPKILIAAVALALTACSGSSGNGSGLPNTSPSIGSTSTNGFNNDGVTTVNVNTGSNNSTATNFNSDGVTTIANTQEATIEKATNSQVDMYNNYVKRNHKSEVQAAMQVNNAQAEKGARGTVIVNDWGIDPNGLNGALKNNVDSDMSTETGNTQTRELGIAHGTRMAGVIVQNASDVNVRASTAINLNTANMAAANKLALQTLNERGELKSTPIINASYSDRIYTDTPNAAEARLMAETSTFGNTKALVVMATGNQGKDTSATSSQLAAVNSDLATRYIAVTGVDDNGKHYSSLNKCGKSAEFCIGAKGDWTLQDGSRTYGTSPATAAVSATAAKVASKYDWMDASQIRDVIFTTLDSSTEGAQTTGLGILNSQRALSGYGAFNKAETVLNVNGADSIYYMSNNIAGAKNGSHVTVVKKGNKTLALTGDNTYKGKTIIQEGGLLLNGKNDSNVEIASNGKLIVGDNTSGVTVGSVTNAGEISAQSLADITIKGDLNTSGSINKYIGSEIKVNGNMNISGGDLNVTGVAKGYVTKNGKTETLISARQVNGSFDKINVKDTTLIGTEVTSDNKGFYATTKRNTVGSAVYKEDMNSNEIQQDAHVAEKALTSIDNQLNADGVLTTKQRAYAEDFVNGSSVAETAFKHGVGTHNRTQVAVARQSQNQVFDLISNTQAGNDVWINYNHNAPRVKDGDISTKMETNGVSLGGTFDVAKGHTIGAVGHQSTTSLNETVINTGKNIEVSTKGIDVAYALDGKNVDMFATVGADRLKVENGGKGEQYRFGAGLSKDVVVNNSFVITPDFGLYYTESDLKNVNITDLSHIDTMSYKNLFAKVGTKAQFQVNDNITTYAGVAVQRDLINKSDYNSTIADAKVADVVKNRKETRMNGYVGVNAKVNNFTVGAKAGYEHGRNYRNAQFGVSMHYAF